MKLFIVLNNEIKSGLAVNALAQMSLGLGHRFKQGLPDVDVYWGSTAEVRACHTNFAKSKSVYSNFPHTMQGGDTTSLIERIESTPESDITYYGCCLVAEDLAPETADLLGNLKQLKGYNSFVSNEAVTLGPVGESTPLPTREEDTKKTTTVVNGDLPLASTINDIVLANIIAGRTIPLAQLHLMRIAGMQGVSFNTHPIVKPDNKNKLPSIISAAEANLSLVVVKRNNTQGTSTATVVFGEKEDVEGVITKKLTRMFEPKVEFDLGRPAQASSALLSLSLLGAGSGRGSEERVVSSTFNP